MKKEIVEVAGAKRPTLPDGSRVVAICQVLGLIERRDG